MRLYQLYREINTLTHETDSVSTYLTKLKSVWNEYDVVVPAPTCICPKSKDYADHLYELRLIQFLSGLNYTYDQARRQILLKGVTPTINQAYAKIVENEITISMCSYRRRKIRSNIGAWKTMIEIRITKERGVTTVTTVVTLARICYKLIGQPVDRKHRKKGHTGNSKGNQQHQYGGYNTQVNPRLN